MRELYARGYASRPVGKDWNDESLYTEVSVGIEIRATDEATFVISDARRLARAGVDWSPDPVEIVRYVEMKLKDDYPDRAYFIETEEDGKGVQVYDPRDFVKERCGCPCTRMEPAPVRAVAGNPNQLEFQFDPEG